MMIKFAEKKDTKNIRKLWDIAFGDDTAFNDYFFKKIFVPEHTLIMEEKNRIVSMAQMLPYSIANVGNATYIYGAATLPEFRGKGYMKRLLEHSFDLDIIMGRTASILIPAEKSLFDYYKSLGYETEFYINKYVYISNNNTDIIKKADKRNIPELMKIYNGDIVRTEEYWKVQLDMFDTLGSSIYIYNNAYAVVSDNVEELFGDKKDKNILLDSVCSILKKDSISVTEKGNDIPFGMIKKHKAIKNIKRYMNLMYN